MLIKWIIPCFPRGPRFIHLGRNQDQPANYQRSCEALIVLGKVNPVLGRRVIKNTAEVTFSAIIQMAWNFDRPYQKQPLMVTLQNFRVMPFEKKCDIITFYGNYLAQRTLADCKVFLYFTEGFFVEVFYSPKYQKVLMINAFEKAIGLDPYLDKISLADLTTAGPSI